jgi:hypothetical protein
VCYCDSTLLLTFLKFIAENEKTLLLWQHAEQKEVKFSLEVG